MPPIVLPSFPEREPKASLYAPLFDGQCWKVAPGDYDYEDSEIKAFVGSLKAAASKHGVYIRSFITIDNHVILQRRPLDYVPPRGGRRSKKPE